MSDARARFWEKVDRRGQDECWLWKACVSDSGYGQFWDGHRLVKAHRFALADAARSAPMGDVDHTCHNRADCRGGPTCLHRSCCNPAHLEDVPHRLNVQRGRAGTIEASRDACPRGHPYDELNTYTNPSGSRKCRQCRAIHQAAYLERRAA